MILFAYQGVGKTYLSKFSNFIDLQPEDYILNNKYDDNWMYFICQTAIRLHSEGKNVCLPLDFTLYDAIREHIDDLWLIFPDLNLKTSWIHKLENRFEEDNWYPHYACTENAKYYYETVISYALHVNENKIIIKDINYDLLTAFSCILLNKDYKDDSLYIFKKKVP